MPSQVVLQEKKEEVEKISELMSRYKSIGMASLHKVRAAQLQELKRKLKEDVFLRVIKNTLVNRSLQRSKEKPKLEALVDHLTGANVFIFTDLNPFKLELLLQKNRAKAMAKAGDTAAEDVTVQAGNTGLPPGPIISQLNNAGIPTRIESGSVWVIKDTLVAKKGEVISQRLANALSKLGVQSVEIGLSVKAIYDDGMILTSDQLHIDLETMRLNLQEAHSLAYNLSINTAFPTNENIKILVQIAHQEAYNLSVNAEIPTKTTITDIIKKVHTETLGLCTSILKVDEKAAPPEFRKVEKEEVEKEEVEKEEVEKEEVEKEEVEKK